MSSVEFHSTSDAATASLSKQGPGITSDEVATILSDQIKNKIVIITGISPDGLGADAARVITQHNPKLLILASRGTKNIMEVTHAIQGHPRADIRPLLLTLSSLDSVRKAAERVLQMTLVVDVLINNAGVMMTPTYQTTPEGLEWHFGVNYIGHFLFTNLIMPALLKAADGACVVNVSSAAHRAIGVNFDDVNFQKGETYEKFLAYAQSKSANLLFCHALVYKLGSKNIRSFGVDPGAAAGTKLSRDIPLSELQERGWWDEHGNPNTAVMAFKSIPESAASYIVAAFDPSISDHNGACITDCAVDLSVAPHVLDKEGAEKLWVLSEKLVGQEFRY